MLGECVCPTGYTEDANGVCQADGDGGCPPNSGKEKNILGECVCPTGYTEDANGVCQADGDGGCPPNSGKEKNILGECVCPTGYTEDANGVCQADGERWQAQVPEHAAKKKMELRRVCLPNRLHRRR
jgi:O-acetyl-ADP-ribose deacetylase (regulator of RNase III)